MWRYSEKSGWEKIEDFLASAGHGHALEDELAKYGFSSSSSFTTGREGKIRIKIYRSGSSEIRAVPIDPTTGKPLEEQATSPVEDEFLAAVEICQRSYKVVLPAFPDLFEFLSRIGTICSAVKNNSQNSVPIEDSLSARAEGF